MNYNQASELFVRCNALINFHTSNFTYTSHSMGNCPKIKNVLKSFKMVFVKYCEITWIKKLNSV